MAEEINQVVAQNAPTQIAPQDQPAETAIPDDLPEVKVTLIGKIINFFRRPWGKIIGFTGLFLGVAALIMYSNGTALKGSFTVEPTIESSTSGDASTSGNMNSSGDATTSGNTSSSSSSSTSTSNSTPAASDTSTSTSDASSAPAASDASSQSSQAKCETGKYLDEGQTPKDCKTLPNILLTDTESAIKEACDSLQKIILNGPKSAMDSDTEKKAQEQAAGTLCKPSAPMTPIDTTTGQTETSAASNANANASTPTSSPTSSSSSSSSSAPIKTLGDVASTQNKNTQDALMSAFPTQASQTSGSFMSNPTSSTSSPVPTPAPKPVITPPQQTVSEPTIAAPQPQIATQPVTQQQPAIPQSLLAEASAPPPLAQEPEQSTIDETSSYPAAGSYISPRSMPGTGPEVLIYGFGLAVSLLGGRKIWRKNK